ncbi:energy-coupling factor transporter ATP-binding protein EcfA2 [Catenuloplanes nepalensis]|uniref:Energy-coupling factor transporter ATP-binding protein EcfA2 n=2 Tax=Catenuloplanes nepalensis TaxID=587533 RepID=A0ABT9N410_9ACTN|nr:energy-coupling factor transporter ATP-binding protein EcfA2 [Catenuloplanes nepalensis]
MQTRGELTPASLAEALDHLRSVVDSTSYPLVMPSAAEARESGSALVTQLDDYLIPRLARLDAPLLAVVGGSTGAGKSTLVNSLVAAKVSASGVLRPTTRAPLLAANPADLDWFRRGELLPGLTRTDEPSTDPKSLQLVGVPTLAPGLALLDAPDIDSVVDANRALAGQLLAAADLWIFVTTAARYADAVPWGLLRTARQRGTVIAMVLDRVPPEAAEEVAAHLAEMLRDNGLGAAPLFVVPETRLTADGLLPPSALGDLSSWIGYLAADAETRADVVRRTLDGALAALAPTTASLADAAEEQDKAAETLADRVEIAYRNANRAVAHGVEDGRLLRGEVLARWQEFVGTGELMRTLEAQIGRLRDRIVSTLTGRPAPGHALRSAIEGNLVTLIRGAADEAAETAYTGWQAHPAGAALLSPPLGRAGPDLPERAERLIRDWQRHVLEMVRAEAGDKRALARGTAYAVNATGLLVMVVVFASTAFIPTGAELAVAGGTTVAAQKVLEAIFGDQAIRTLAAKARADLLDRVSALLAEEAARFTTLVEPVPGAAGRLRGAALDVEAARADAALVTR